MSFLSEEPLGVNPDVAMALQSWIHLTDVNECYQRLDIAYQ